MLRLAVLASVGVSALGACVDDPTSLIAGNQSSCTDLETSLGCAGDLKALISLLPEGTLVSSQCPVTCGTCPTTAAPGVATTAAPGVATTAAPGATTAAPGATTAAPNAGCVDDQTGDIAALNLDCTAVLGMFGGDCFADLNTEVASIPQGTLLREYCRVTCKNCPGDPIITQAPTTTGAPATGSVSTMAPMGSTAAPTGCRDDPTGNVAALNLNCGLVIQNFGGCEADLSLLNSAIPQGTLGKDVCPATCANCPCLDDPNGVLAPLSQTCDGVSAAGCDYDLNGMSSDLPVGTLVLDVCPVTCQTCPVPPTNPPVVATTASPSGTGATNAPGAGTDAPSECKDDPTGDIEAQGFNCALVVGAAGGCDGDLGVLSDQIPDGTLARTACPFTCGDCPGSTTGTGMPVTGMPGSGTMAPATGTDAPCFDDPTGDIKDNGLTCDMIKTLASNDCDIVLSTLNPAAPPGVTLRQACPATCGDCPISTTGTDAPVEEVPLIPDVNQNLQWVQIKIPIVDVDEVPAEDIEKLLTELCNGAGLTTEECKQIVFDLAASTNVGLDVRTSGRKVTLVLELIHDPAQTRELVKLGEALFMELYTEISDKKLSQVAQYIVDHVDVNGIEIKVKDLILCNGKKQTKECKDDEPDEKDKKLNGAQTGAVFGLSTVAVCIASVFYNM